ncbi:hypothetical protein O6H91_01G080000 [Diphasiastrum complanatum]|nr:hypothetical protein O6H91_01G080000 [Diphasiastrum complanatum]
MKMVLSATLTKDPVKISQLKLHHPLYIASSAGNNLYKLPPQLKAFKLVCKADDKPLMLVALLQTFGKQRTIIFTASVVATHRLYVFLKCFEGLSSEVQEYSSLQHQMVRSKALEAFRGGDAHILVASDGMARGMDVDGVVNIVNYDMPVYIKTYIHRVGRTARAGRAGCSFTFLRKEEVRHFKSLLKKAQNSSCKNYRLPSSAVEALQPRYMSAFEKFKEFMASETAVSTGSHTKQATTNAKYLQTS